MVSRGGQSRPPWPRGHGKSWLNRGGWLCPPRLTDLPRWTPFVARRGYVDLPWQALLFARLGKLFPKLKKIQQAYKFKFKSHPDFTD